MMKILTKYLPPQVVALKKPNKIQAGRLSIVSSSALINDMVGASTMYACATYRNKLWETLP